MDQFKRDHFERDHPGQRFPVVVTLTSAEARTLRDRIALKLRLLPSITDVELTNRIAQNATTIEGVNASEDGFDLVRLLQELNIKPKSQVLLNWYRYDDIDRMALIDLSRNFADIWYPSSDDVEIFDDSCAWILAVAHSGDVRLAVIDPDA